jgi:hypothetical protein
MTLPYGLQPELIEALRPVAYAVTHKDLDCVIAVVGRERLGKSMLATRIGSWFAAAMAAYKGEKNPNKLYSEKNIAYTAAQYAKLVDELPEGGVAQYDEAARGWYARSSMSTENKELNTLLMTCGDRNLVHIVCLPNFFALDVDVRFRRTSAVCDVFAPVGAIYDKEKKEWNWELSRGWFDFYAGEDIARIYQDPLTRQVRWPRSPCMGWRFEAWAPDNPFWDRYDAKSHEKKGELRHNIARKLAQHEKKLYKDDEDDVDG